MFSRLVQSQQSNVWKTLVSAQSKMGFAVIRRFSKEHEWIEYDDATKTGIIGITTHAAKELGDIVHIEMPEIGLKFTAGNSIGSIESVKVAADVFAPIDGSINQVNEQVSEDPSLVNVDPNVNWFLKVNVTNEAQVKALLTEEQYKKLLDELSSH